MVNKVILIGNVGKEPETKTFDGGGQIAKFSLATTEKWKDKQGNKKESTEWHNIVCSRPGLTKVVEQYVHKGDKLYIEGRIKTRTWEKDGKTHYATDIRVDNLTMLGSGQPQQQQQQPVSAEDSPLIDDDDDLPFS